MSDLKRDPVVNAIQNGIKDDIDFNHKGRRHRATLILIYAAIDAMAFLNMPELQTDVTRKDGCIAESVGKTEKEITGLGPQSGASLGSKAAALLVLSRLR